MEQQINRKKNLIQIILQIRSKIKYLTTGFSASVEFDKIIIGFERQYVFNKFDDRIKKGMSLLKLLRR